MSETKRSKQLEGSSRHERESDQAQNDIDGQIGPEIPNFCSPEDMMQISPRFPDCQKIELQSQVLQNIGSTPRADGGSLTSLPIEGPKVQRQSNGQGSNIGVSPQMNTKVKITPSGDVKKNDQQISHTNENIDKSESNENQKQNEQINVIVVDLDSQDDSLLKCGENMEALPLSNLQKPLSAETPLAGVQLQISSINQKLVSEPKKFLEIDHKYYRSGSKDLKNQAQKVLGEMKSHISTSRIHSPNIPYNQIKINMLPLAVSPNVLQGPKVQASIKINQTSKRDLKRQNTAVFCQPQVGLSDKKDLTLSNQNFSFASPAPPAPPLSPPFSKQPFQSHRNRSPSGITSNGASAEKSRYGSPREYAIPQRNKSEISNVDRNFYPLNYSQAIIDQKIGNASPSPTKHFSNCQNNFGQPSVVETSSKGRYVSPQRMITDQVDVSSAKKRFDASNTAKKFRTKTSKKGGSYIYSNFKINQNSLQRDVSTAKKDQQRQLAQNSSHVNKKLFGESQSYPQEMNQQIWPVYEGFNNPYGLKMNHGFGINYTGQHFMPITQMIKSESRKSKRSNKVQQESNQKILLPSIIKVGGDSQSCLDSAIKSSTTFLSSPLGKLRKSKSKKKKSDKSKNNSNIKIQIRRGKIGALSIVSSDKDTPNHKSSNSSSSQDDDSCSDSSSGSGSSSTVGKTVVYHPNQTIFFNQGLFTMQYHPLIQEAQNMYQVIREHKQPRCTCGFSKESAKSDESKQPQINFYHQPQINFSQQNYYAPHISEQTNINYGGYPWGQQFYGGFAQPQNQQQQTSTPAAADTNNDTKIVIETDIPTKKPKKSLKLGKRQQSSTTKKDDPIKVQKSEKVLVTPQQSEKQMSCSSVSSVVSWKTGCQQKRSKKAKGTSCKKDIFDKPDSFTHQTPKKGGVQQIIVGQKSQMKTTNTLNVSELKTPGSFDDKINMREFHQNFGDFNPGSNFVSAGKNEFMGSHSQQFNFQVPNGPQDSAAQHDERKAMTGQKQKAKKLSTNGTIIHSTRRSQQDKEKDIKEKEEQIKIITVRILKETITQKQHFDKLEKAQQGQSCKGCKCKNNKCLKLYCVCLANGALCGDSCQCKKLQTECHNTDEHQEERKKAIEEILGRNINAFEGKVNKEKSQHQRGCNCKNSSCQKNYCECYENGLACIPGRCKCVNCKNEKPCGKHEPVLDSIEKIQFSDESVQKSLRENESNSFQQRKFKPDEQDLREETIIDSIMATPIIEVLEKQIEFEENCIAKVKKEKTPVAQIVTRSRASKRLQNMAEKKA